MTRRMLMLLVLAVVFTSCAKPGPDVFPTTFPEFSADVKYSGLGDGTGKIYSTGEKIRLEVDGQILIARFDRGILWRIDGASRVVTVEKITPTMAGWVLPKIGEETQWVEEDKEKVGKIKARKFSFEWGEGDGLQRGFKWIGADSIPVKIQRTESDPERVYEYQNIKKEPQFAYMFDLSPDMRRQAATMTDPFTTDEDYEKMSSEPAIVVEPVAEATPEPAPAAPEGNA